MRVSRRKTTAMRSPSSTPLLQEKEAARSSSITHHAIPPNTFVTPSLQSLIYATFNDRYPGAPGTSLHRAKLEAARAAAATRREMQKEIERREEMKRLGILGVGKKRVVGGAAAAASNGNGSAAASNGGNSRYSTPPVPVERLRRGQASVPVAVNGHTSNTSSSSSASSRISRANGRNLGNAIDHNSLPIPASPLLSSSGRLRRPASTSRGASPMPLTSQASGHTNGTLSSRVRSPIVAPIDLETVDDSAGNAALR